MNDPISTKIKERRKQLGITQHDLAELSGTSEKTVRDLEKGNANPRLQTLIAVLAVLGLVFLLSNILKDD
mgnify:FL=1